MIHQFLYDDEEVPTVEQLLEECKPLQAKSTNESILSGIEMQAVEELPAVPLTAKQEQEGLRKVKKKRTRVMSSKKTTDRHVKVNGRGRSVQLPNACEDELFELTRRLNYKWAGQTICWLLENTEQEIIKTTSGREKKN